MKSVLKPVSTSVLLQSFIDFIDCRKTSYVHQFKTQTQTHYPDRQGETKRMQENFEVSWWLTQTKRRICLKGHYYKLQYVSKGCDNIANQGRILRISDTLSS